MFSSVAAFAESISARRSASVFCRVAAEDHAIGGARSALDRFLTPANRLSSRRFLREARNKVWLNVAELQRARLAGADAYHDRLAELEVLSAAKIADLSRPGRVLLRLAMTRFSGSPCRRHNVAGH